MQNNYIPQLSRIKEVIRHTDLEYTFRMEYKGDLKPGQFFEVSIPKFGEAPISVSGIQEDTVDFTIRRVGAVTNEIFENYVGDSFYIRGPYGNGFDLGEFKGKELVIIGGGTGVSPVRGIVQYFSEHPEEAVSTTLIAGFKNPDQILFKEDFKKWQEKLQVILTVDSAEEGYTGPVGMVTKYISDLKFQDINNAVFVCVGPPVMIRFTIMEIQKLGVKDQQIWTSYERKMCCGLGKCGHCRMNEKYVCLDGPVFNYAQARELFD